MAHSFIGHSVSLLPPDQDLKVAEGFEVRVALFGTADRPFVIDCDGMPATFRQGEAHRLSIDGYRQDSS